MIFVTGGTGLVGSHLLLELARGGKKVRALKRASSDIGYVDAVFRHYAENATEIANNIEWVEGDILDPSFLLTALEGVKYVYHCAAVVSFQPSDREKIHRINTDGTANIVNASLQCKVKKLCYVSSIAALGRSEHKEFVDETVGWKVSKDNSCYSISKFNAEREVWRGTAEGLDAVIVNPSIVIGFANPSKGSTKMFSTVWNGLNFYTPGMNGFVDVKDVVKVMVMLQESDIRNERFILNATNVTFKAFFNKIADSLGKPRPRWKSTALLAEMAWRLDWLRSKILNREPLITRQTVKAGMGNFKYSNAKIRKYTGVEFRDIDVSIKEVSDIFKKYYKDEVQS